MEPTYVGCYEPVHSKIKVVFARPNFYFRRMTKFSRPLIYLAASWVLLTAAQSFAQDTNQSVAVTQMAGNTATDPVPRDAEMGHTPRRFCAASEEGRH